MIYAEMNHMRFNAQQIWSAASRATPRELSKAQEAEKSQKWSAAVEDVYGKLKDKLPDTLQ